MSPARADAEAEPGGGRGAAARSRLPAGNLPSLNLDQTHVPAAAAAANGPGARGMNPLRFAPHTPSKQAVMVRASASPHTAAPLKHGAASRIILFKQLPANSCLTPKTTTS